MRRDDLLRRSGRVSEEEAPRCVMGGGWIIKHSQALNVNPERWHRLYTSREEEMEFDILHPSLNKRLLLRECSEGIRNRCSRLLELYINFAEV